MSTLLEVEPVDLDEIHICDGLHLSVVRKEPLLKNVDIAWDRTLRFGENLHR